MMVERNKFILFGFVMVVGVVSSAENSGEIISTSSSSIPDPHPHHHRIVNLKHRRFKSIRDNITTVATSPLSSQSTSSSERIGASPTVTYHDHIHVLPTDPLHHHKSPRGGGFDLQKSPPDLQFGLAFTVPFVSLSTEKLIHGVAGKGFDSVSSLLKLNFSGLFLAAVVGIVALAGLFLPSVLSRGGGGGWGGGNGILDGLFPNQYTDGLYNDYENGWGGGPGSSLNKPWGKSEFGGGGKEFGGRRNGRKRSDFVGALASGVMRLAEKVRGSVGVVEECVVERVCGEVMSEGNDGIVSNVILEFKDSELFKSSEIGRRLRAVVVDKEVGGCDGKDSKVNNKCEGLSNVEEVVKDLVKSWGGGGGVEDESDKKKKKKEE